MVAATAARGLSGAELESIRSTLASGRKPKVVFTEAAGQIAGQSGQVVELLEPSDDEWIVVRFGHDELPFSPADLAIASRVPIKRTPKPVAAAAVPARMASTGTTSGPDRRPSNKTTAVLDMPRQEVPMPAPKTSTVDKTVDKTAQATPTEEAKVARKTAAKVAKPKPTPSLVVTVAYADGEWTVGAQQGARSLAKPYMIRPAEALQLVGMLDVPGVHEAVEQIVEVQRTATQARAVRLRAELAEIEARLADLPSTR